MKEAKELKGILFVCVTSHDSDTSEAMVKYRIKTLEMYCAKNQIGIIHSYIIEGANRTFEKDILPQLQNDKELTMQADFLLMHDLQEISFYLAPALTLALKVNMLGIKPMLIRDFAVSIHRY
ncbi:MAG: hypothetical protein ACJ77K_06520 [Bacteroidia bacterium]